MEQAAAEAMATREQSATGPLTVAQLDALCYAYADQYMARIAAACDHIRKNSDDPAVRVAAAWLKAGSASNVVDIVTNGDPFTKLIDLVLVITLQSNVWIDENRAEELFPGVERPLIDALRAARVDVWELAARAMKPDQLETLDYLIWTWRRKNPDVEYVLFVRFSDFAASRGVAQIRSVRAGGGLLAPVAEAAQTAEEIRMLGERAFFAMKRMPMIAAWNAQAAAEETIAGPETAGILGSVRQLSSSIDGLSGSIDGASGTFERLPDEIGAEVRSILDELDGRLAGLEEQLGWVGPLVQDGRLLANEAQESVLAAQELSKSLDAAAASLERTLAAGSELVVQLQHGSEEETTTLQQAGELADRLGTAAERLHEILIELKALAGTPELASGATTLAEAADARVRSYLNAALWRGLVLAAGFVAMLTAGLIIAGRVSRPRGAAA